jgi:hypothetical protein
VAVEQLLKILGVVLNKSNYIGMIEVKVLENLRWDPSSMRVVVDDCKVASELSRVMDISMISHS